MGWFDTSTSTSATNTANNPWAPAQGDLKGILAGLQPYASNPGLTGAESGALSGLEGIANRGNPYAAGIGGYANSMLAGGGANNGSPMVNNAYDAYTKAMNPTANGDYLDPNKNPWFGTTTNTIANDVTNRVNGMFAGAGRDMSGANIYNLSRGVAEGVAPVYSDAYNRERTNQLNAQSGLYNAGNNTAGILSGFQNQFNQNQGAGVDAAGRALNAEAAPYNAMLAAEAQRRGIPMSLMQQLAGIAAPIAQLGGTSTSNTTGTQTASGLQQITGIMQGVGSMMPKGNMTFNF